MFLYYIIVIITIMSVKLDEKDLAILALIQEDSQLTAKQIAKKVSAPLTTVFAKVKRMEEQGVIRGFHAILAPEKLEAGTSAFILASVSYRSKNDGVPVSQKDCCGRNCKICRGSRSAYYYRRLGSAS